MSKIKEYLQEMNIILKEKQNSNFYKSLYDDNNSLEIYANDYTGSKILDSIEIIKIAEADENKKIVYKSSGIGKKSIIFPKNIFNINIKPEDEKNEPIIIPIEEFNKVYYKMDKNKINKEEYFKSNNIEKASLHVNFEFEDDIILADKEALNYLRNYVKTIKEDLNFFELLKQNKFEDCCIKPQKVLGKLEKFQHKLTYSQDNSGNKAEFSFNNLIESFISLTKYLQDLISLLKIPDEICKETKQFTKSNCIFSNVLKVRIPKINTSYQNVGFDKIKNYNSLVSPIISFDEQSKKLICSLNKVNSKFKPIIGSLYMNSFYTISFISSVNEKLDLKIEYTQDFYKRYFSQMITNESIEINIKVPENKEKEEKDIEIKGNLKFIYKNYSELSLPFCLFLKFYLFKFYLDERNI